MKEHIQNQNLAKLEIGKSYLILGFRSDLIASRLLQMGISKGDQLKVLRSAPFNGAYYVQIEQSNIALRAEELKSILLKGI